MRASGSPKNSFSNRLRKLLREQTIVRDLTLRLVVTLAIADLFVGVIFFVIQTRNESNALKTKVTAGATQLSALLSLPMWTFNETEIKSLIGTHGMLDEISDVTILDDAKKTLARVRKNGQSRDITASRDIAYKGQKIGVINVSASTSPLYARAFKNLGMILIATILAILTVAFLVTYLLHRYLENPLNNLVSGIQRIASGKYAVRLPNATQKEFSRITDEVHSMADKIALRELQIKESMETATLLRTELGIAETIQRSMISTHGFNTAKRVSQFYQPMNNLSGDWMTVFECDKGSSIYALVGDVTGHGIPQGLVTMAAFGAIQTLKPLIQQNSRSFTPAAILNILRSSLATLLHECNLAMTVSVIKIDTESRELSMSSAGHPLPLVLRPGSDGFKVRVMTAKTQSPLGFEFLTRSTVPPAYQDSHHKLEADDTILVFSDGLTEARDRADIQFQKKFVATLKSQDKRYPPSILLDRILQTLRTHMDGSQAKDDICLLVIDTRKDDGHEAVA